MSLPEPYNTSPDGRIIRLAREEDRAEGRVIHVDELDAFPDAVYIGRAVPRRGLPASPWANPYRIGRDGDRQTVIARYERELRRRPELLAALSALRGRPLACWCRRSDQPSTPATACHGDVLLRLLAAHTDADLRLAAERLRQQSRLLPASEPARQAALLEEGA